MNDENIEKSAADNAADKKAEKGKKQAPTGNNALKAAGTAACKRHGLAEVWVTTDGQAFPQQGDAKAHAANLANKEILKVTSK